MTFHSAYYIKNISLGSFLDAGRDDRTTWLARPNFQARTGTAKNMFPFQLTTNRIHIGNRTRLLHALIYGHTYIDLPTYSICMRPNSHTTTVCVFFCFSFFFCFYGDRCRFSRVFLYHCRFLFLLYEAYVVRRTYFSLPGPYTINTVPGTLTLRLIAYTTVHLDESPTLLYTSPTLLYT